MVFQFIELQVKGALVFKGNEEVIVERAIVGLDGDGFVHDQFIADGRLADRPSARFGDPSFVVAAAEEAGFKGAIAVELDLGIPQDEGAVVVKGLEIASIVELPTANEQVLVIGHFVAATGRETEQTDHQADKV